MVFRCAVSAAHFFIVNSTITEKINLKLNGAGTLLKHLISNAGGILL